ITGRAGRAAVTPTPCSNTSSRHSTFAALLRITFAVEQVTIRTNRTPAPRNARVNALLIREPRRGDLALQGGEERPEPERCPQSPPFGPERGPPGDGKHRPLGRRRRYASGVREPRVDFLPGVGNQGLVGRGGLTRPGPCPSRSARA